MAMLIRGTNKRSRKELGADNPRPEVRPPFKGKGSRAGKELGFKGLIKRDKGPRDHPSRPEQPKGGCSKGKAEKGGRPRGPKM